MAYERPLTLEEARRLLYKHATDDPTDEDYRFRTALNEALERLMSAGIWEGRKRRLENEQMKPLIVGNILTLPIEYESLMAVTVCDSPRNIFEDSHEFHSNGPGIMDAGDGGCIVIDLGFNLVDDQYCRQYKFTEDVTTNELVGLVKYRFQHVTLDSDIVSPSNIGALKHAILAICYEGEGALEASIAYWEEAYRILNKEKETSNIGVIKSMPQNPWGIGINKTSNMF